MVLQCNSRVWRVVARNGLTTPLVSLLRSTGEDEPCSVGQYDHPEHLPVGPAGQGPEHIRYAREGVVLLALPGASRTRQGQLHVRPMCFVHQGKR